MKFKSILAIGAHPDDIEFSCFGFLLKQNSYGANIFSFIVSPDTEEFGILEKRINESKKSFQLIPESTLFVREKNKITNDEYMGLTDYIRDIVIKNNIDLVLVHDINDTHQEHRLIHEITISALRRLPVSIFLYKSPSTTNNFISNCIINIEDQYAIKIAAIREHKSQSDKDYLTEESLNIFNSGWNGKNININYFEEFKILRLVEK